MGGALITSGVPFIASNLFDIPNHHLQLLKQTTHGHGREKDVYSGYRGKNGSIIKEAQASALTTKKIRLVRNSWPLYDNRDIFGSFFFFC